MTDLLTAPPSRNGHGALTDLQPLARRRRARLPEVAIGLLVMLGFGLAAVLWQLNATQKDPVLALANDVRRGEVIDRADLRVVFVATDDAIAHVRRDDAASIIGHAAAADLPVGALLTRASVVAGSILNAGEGIVGLALEPGQVPSADLRSGDIVNVVVGATTDGAGVRSGEVVVRGAEVYSVEPETSTGRILVSLKTSEENANRIATAAEAGPVRLVWVGA